MNDTRSDAFTKVEHFREVSQCGQSLIVYYSCLLSVDDSLLDPVRYYAKQYCCVVESSDRIRDTEMMTGYARIVEIRLWEECPSNTHDVFPHYCKHSTITEVPLD